MCVLGLVGLYRVAVKASQPILGGPFLWSWDGQLSLRLAAAATLRTADIFALFSSLFSVMGTVNVGTFMCGNVRMT